MGLIFDEDGGDGDGALAYLELPHHLGRSIPKADLAYQNLHLFLSIYREI